MDKHLLQTEIEQLGLLKYADPSCLIFVKESLLENIISKQAFFFPSGDNHKNINGRLFSFDGESLAEAGALDLFNEIRPSLEKAGLIINNAEQFFDDTKNSKIPTYTFTLNNETCNLAANTFIPFLLWASVTRKYVVFLNNALRKNKLQERIYFMNDSCSGTELAFLTPVQAKFINGLQLNPNDRVYKFTYLTQLKPVFIITSFILKSLFKKKIKSTTS